ncbi:hypothetical protein ACBJ59_03005 [Nonomuraea sp. MTCD27]|uniref:hypothetical protein n=1 Tax=Nonomuraea sp. MTCD27 TaxID=1676747 RepID=UPI0035C16FAA
MKSTRLVEHVAAIAVTLLGGTVVAFAAYDGNAISFVSLVVVPALLVALFVLPLLSVARPRGPRRSGWRAAAVLGGGLLLLAAITPKFALLLVLIAVLYLTIGWPLAASAACVAAVAAVRSALSPGPATSPRTWGRMSWTWLLSAVATYGYGLTHLNDYMLDVKDGICRVIPSGEQAEPGGTQTLLPLSDSLCGADTVPGFVNPLLAALAGLLAASATMYVVARCSASRARRHDRRHEDRTRVLPSSIAGPDEAVP